VVSGIARRNLRLLSSIKLQGFTILHNLFITLSHSLLIVMKVITIEKEQQGEIVFELAFEKKEGHNEKRKKHGRVSWQ
jgi:hypothetical protein